jgi:hypothetical protein
MKPPWLPRRRARNRPQTAVPLDPQLERLRAWQSDRLAHTHADWLASPRYGPACRFFLEDLYGPHDFSGRDEDILNVYQSVRRWLPGALIHPLRLVVELNELTHALDAALLRELAGETGVVESITAEQYAAAYRRCDNYAERARQIDLIVTIGQEIDQVTRLPFVETSLRLAHQPAHWAGWGELQDFLERGFAAFKQMGDATPFLQSVGQRERQILDQIYAGAPDPFDV